MQLSQLALVATLASCGRAHVEKQFQLPDFLRQPFYDVDITEGPLVDLDRASADRVVSINHIGRPLKCVLPETTTNVTLEPLNDTQAIAEARNILRKYRNTTHMHLDDVWGWNFKFNENIVQFFPEEGPEPGVFHLSSSSFQVYIGKDDDAPGHVSLDDAVPVIIDDQYMLHARFVNGSMCDLTLEPRIANVFFACAPDALLGVPSILSIDEPYSCTYEFVVGLRELCDVEAFRAPKLPVNMIRCGLDPAQILEEPSVEAASEYHYVNLGSGLADDIDFDLDGLHWDGAASGRDEASDSEYEPKFLHADHTEPDPETADWSAAKPRKDAAEPKTLTYVEVERHDEL